MAKEIFLITWSATTGTKSTLAMLRERLAHHKISPVLLVLSQLAGLLKTWENDIDFDAHRKAMRELLPSHSSAINRFRTDQHIGFGRISLLFVAQQACTACQQDGETLELPSALEPIFECCLMANDLIVERQLTPNDSTLERAASLLPLASYVSHNTYPRDLARNLVLFERIAPQLRGTAHYRDMTAEFISATGVSPRDFCELAFTASVKWITWKSNAADSFVLTPRYLQNASIPPESVAAFFKKTSILPEDLHALTRRQEALRSVFIVFQRHPLIEIKDARYVCPDPGFLFDKGGKSLYWTLHDAQPSSERHQLLTCWSAIFERYVHWLFDQTYQGRGKVKLSPRFENGDEAFDAVVLEGSRLIVIEVKASVLTVAAKYGFSPETLGRELHQKAITGEDGERKGVAQLHENLRRFLDGDNIEGINRDLVKVIYPVLVFLDPSFTSPYLPRLYNEHFNRHALRRSPKRTIAPLAALTIDDLENVLPYTHQHTLAEMLDSCWHLNKSRAPEHMQFQVPLLDGRQPGKDVVRERFNEFGQAFTNRRAQADGTR